MYQNEIERIIFPGINVPEINCLIEEYRDPTFPRQIIFVNSREVEGSSTLFLEDRADAFNFLLTIPNYSRFSFQPQLEKENRPEIPQSSMIPISDRCDQWRSISIFLHNTEKRRAEEQKNRREEEVKLFIRSLIRYLTVKVNLTKLLPFMSWPMIKIAIT